MSSSSLLQTQAFAALCVVEPGGLEDGPVFGASCGSLTLPVSPGQQHLCEAHIHGAERTLHQALQEEGDTYYMFLDHKNISFLHYSS